MKERHKRFYKKEALQIPENVSEYGFSLTRTFPHKDRIKDFDLIRENTSETEPVFWRIIRSERFNTLFCELVNSDITIHLSTYSYNALFEQTIYSASNF